MSRSKARLLFLGTGTSEGIPCVSCLTSPAPQQKCPICWSARYVEGSRNHRRNTGVVIEVPAAAGERPRTLAIDCGKMWWESVVSLFPAAGFRCLDAMVLTHDHADAVLGLDDLRDFTKNMPEHTGLSVYANGPTLERLHGIFPYLFPAQKEPEVAPTEKVNGGVPQMTWQQFTDGTSFEPLPGVVCTPFNVEHGGCHNMSVFRIGSLAYISDVSRFPEGSRKYLRGAKQVVLDALQPAGTHPSHLTLEQATEEVRSGFGIGLVPEEVWFVGMNHRIDHDAANSSLQSASLPCKVALAYDGLEISIELYDHTPDIAEE
mmetsp:Transcript_68488/g.164480  ORF Transcript_68488/g.164480 Transcript_68488/m.164480 type:complete len:318 (+) Transcript_68488:41-994(+)